MSFDSERYTVCTYDGTRDELRLADRDGRTYLRSFENLSRTLERERERVRFAMNAGMFNDFGAPVGLYVEDGVRGHRISLRRGTGNFHLLPNGVFWQDADGDVHVTESRAYAASPRAPRLATQSGPMLVIDGAVHPRFSEDGDSRLIRNGVGVSDAHTAYFVISETDVSFGKFARFFRNRLHCHNALFLDGNVSSLWAPSLGRRDDARLLGPMIVVLSRP
ncbi:MAG: phosphodiester glycosidase family protein [Vitreimonas sp.]